LMVTKAELLYRLSREQLAKIAKAEGVSVPKHSRKPTYVNKLLKLKMSRIREYVEEYIEEIERTTIIKEKIKKRGRIKEKTTLVFEAISREKLINKLMDVTISRNIIDSIARRTRSAVSGRSRFKVYGSLNESALDTLFRVFVKHENDRTGRFLEYRFGNWLLRRNKDVVNMEFRKKLIGESRSVHEIDIVGYNNKANVFVIGECKSQRGPATKDHITKWINIVTDLIKNNDDYPELEYAYFVSRGYYADDSIKMLDGATENGKLKLGWFGPSIKMQLYEERDGKISSVYPS